MGLGAEVNPKMRRIKNKAVSKDNGPFPHDEPESYEPTMAVIYRLLKRGFEEMDKHFNEMTSNFDRQDKRFEDIENNQRLAGLQHQAQQPRLAVEADVRPDMKNRERIWMSPQQMMINMEIYRLPGLMTTRCV